MYQQDGRSGEPSGNTQDDRTAAVSAKILVALEGLDLEPEQHAAMVTALIDALSAARAEPEGSRRAWRISARSDGRVTTTTRRGDRPAARTAPRARGRRSAGRRSGAGSRTASTDPGDAAGEPPGRPRRRLTLARRLRRGARL
jgi:hypothetical protein